MSILLMMLAWMSPAAAQESSVDQADLELLLDMFEEPARVRSAKRVGFAFSTPWKMHYAVMGLGAALDHDLTPDGKSWGTVCSAEAWLGMNAELIGIADERANAILEMRALLGCGYGWSNGAHEYATFFIAIDGNYLINTISAGDAELTTSVYGLDPLAGIRFCSPMNRELSQSWCGGLLAGVRRGAVFMGQVSF